MSITINYNNDIIKSVETEGDWRPHVGLLTDKVKDLAEKIFSDQHYMILDVRVLKGQIIIKYMPPSSFVFSCTPESDPFQAFDEPHMPLMLSKLENQYKERAFTQTVGTMKEVRAAVKEEKNIEVLWLRGHGSHKSLQLGDGQDADASLNVDNVEEYLDVFNRVNPKNGVIILEACCPQRNNLLAEKVHQLTGRTVYAYEGSYGYKGRAFLVRETNNQFSAIGLGDRNQNITTIFQNRQRKKYLTTDALAIAKSQGYAIGDPTVSTCDNQKYISDAFERMSHERLQLMHNHSPDHPALTHQLALSYLRENNKEEAIKLLQHALSLGHDLSKSKLEELMREDDQAMAERINNQKYKKLVLLIDQYIATDLSYTGVKQKLRDEMRELYKSFSPELQQDKKLKNYLWIFS